MRGDDEGGSLIHRQPSGCHFGSRLEGWKFCSMGPGIGGDSCIASPGPFDSVEDSGEDLFLGLVLCLLGLGFACGWFCHSFWVRGLTLQRPAKVLKPRPWVRLVARALRFIRRRRAVSLAFSSYRESSLRQSVQSRPNGRRRAHTGSLTPRTSPINSDVVPLREGPVIDNGPNRRGA